MTFRLLSYNIRYGGAGREAALAAAISARAPDVVVLQEATRPDIVERLAAATGMSSWGAQATHSVGFMSRLPVAGHAWYRPPACRRAFLEVELGSGLRVFGVHLSALHSNWTERRRMRELAALLAAIQVHQHGPHVLAGDFNTLAPGEQLDLGRLPRRLRALAWLSGRTIRWQTIQMMLDASYVDAFRLSHGSKEPGYTFPTWDPHVRLDFAFLPAAFKDRVVACNVVSHEAVKAASDHLPLLAEIST